MDLFTDQRFRRQGLARALLSKCLNEAARTARSQVALRADTGNTPAVRLYQAMGFKPYQPDRETWITFAEILIVSAVSTHEMLTPLGWARQGLPSRPGCSAILL